jgi:hypothetical protein
MSKVQDTIHVHVEYFDGQEENDTGYPYYVASCDEQVAVTDGRNWHELLQNIQSMIAASLEDEDAVTMYNLTLHPQVVITREN